MEKQTMGSFIAALRRAAGMTQRELAERLNVSDKAVSRWERDECAPDLMLIPVIADLFGITADELLRGRRKPSSEGAGIVDERKQERERELSEKSVRTLAKRKLEKLRWFSLISAGIGAAGLVVALICDSVLFASKLGFFLSFLLYIPAAIMEIISIASFFSSMEAITASSFTSATEESMRAWTASFRVQSFRWCTAVFTLLGGFIGMVCPLSEAPPHRGGYIAPLSFTLFLAVMGAIVAFVLCRWVVCRILVEKEILPTPAPLTESGLARRKLVKRWVLIGGIVMAVTAIGMAFFNNLPVSTFAKAKVFYDYDSFVEYMELGQYQEQGFSEEYIAEIVEQMELDPEYEILMDPNEKELCRYRRSYHDAVVQMKYSFDKSADGLPVYVYTDRAMERAGDIRDGVNGMFMLLFATEIAVCGLLCFRKWKKL